MSAHRLKLFPKNGIRKCLTGIDGLDQISEGGLPEGRATLVCGPAGCGKTVLAMEFLVRGATEFNEPGVFIAFEETGEELSQNAASMGIDLPGLCARKKLAVDHVRVDRSEIAECGDYDLAGRFVRLEAAIKAIGAKRVVLDTVSSLFSGLANVNILRAELRRLFSWLKSKGITAVITAEKGEGKLTREGIEEYVADCVILLDHRVENQTSIRLLRVIKYRGSMHGTNEYPFLIGSSGLSVLPLSSLRLDHKAPTQRIPTGVPRLDTMLGGKGFYRGSSILVSGGEGTGKSSLAAHFVKAACQRGERALYMSSERSTDEVMRNMRSIGIDLEPFVKRGLLHLCALRPGTFSLETHLLTVHNLMKTFNPKVMVVDPITNFVSLGTHAEVGSMVTRLIDMIKSRQITGMFTSFTSADSLPDFSEVGVSSQMDTWLLLRNLECNGERNRGLYVLKSRGMAHSNQIRTFVLTDTGIRLLDVYVGPSGLLTGSARMTQEAQEHAEATEREQRLKHKGSELKQKRQQLEARIASMRSEYELEEKSLLTDVHEMEMRGKQIALGRVEMSRARKADRIRGNGRGPA